MIIIIIRTSKIWKVVIMCPLYYRQQKEESESADQSLLDERATESSL
jgi:hypothetical protein